MDGVNKREFTRIPLTMAVEVTSGDTTIVSAQTKDLSMKGLYLECDEHLSVGAECQVLLFLGDGHEGLRIEAIGNFVRVDDAGVGIAFSEIVGLDSFEHLRNIVLNNAPETTEVEQELKEHVGLRRRT